MMAKAIEWTEAQDTTIRRLRSGGATWDVIADALRVSRWTAIERGREIGAAVSPAILTGEIGIDLDRDPLPAGHCETWGAIIAGTPLDGAAFASAAFA